MNRNNKLKGKERRGEEIGKKKVKLKEKKKTKAR